MRENKGYSLIELIVVIAIMVVLTGMLVWGFSSVTNQEAKKAISLIDGYLNQTQTTAMTKTQGYCMISMDAEGNYFASLQDGTSKKLGDSKLVIDYQLEGTTGWKSITKSQPLILSYEKSSGAFLPVITQVESDRYVYLTTKGGDNSDISAYAASIRIQKGNYEKQIQLYPKTGKHQVES